MTKLLLVDDNQQNLYMLQVLFSAHDFDVELASNGAEALERARDTAPDLIISDILMPVMDGFTLCRTWMEDELLRTIPFVFYTATYTDPKDEDFALKLGATRFIIKPLEPQKFLAVVQEIIAEHENGEPTTLESPSLEDIGYYKAYNATLISKLEDKLQQLEKTNRVLELEIAERKRAEDALRILNNELELRVHRRTSEIEAINEGLQEFASIVSHDLKAPLRGIHQIAQWLKEDFSAVLGERGQELLDLLIDRVNLLKNLINGILRYSKAAHVSEHEDSIDLNMLVPQIIDMLAAPEHISIQIETPLPNLFGDPTRITQVFQNLLSNAVKFMDKPIGKITVAAEKSDTMWTFRIQDNGPGIKPQDHERIFHIFHTTTPQEKSENTGIGLAVVKKIVGLYHGRVWVESMPGQGSQFFFTWPERPQEQK